MRKEGLDKVRSPTNERRNIEYVRRMK